MRHMLPGGVRPVVAFDDVLIDPIMRDTPRPERVINARHDPHVPDDLLLLQLGLKLLELWPDD